MSTRRMKRPPLTMRKKLRQNLQADVRGVNKERERERAREEAQKINFILDTKTVVFRYAASATNNEHSLD